MIRRLFLGLAAAAAFAAAAAVLVFALAFTVYALAEPRVGRAGAAAVVAGITAFLIALSALFLGMAARSKSRTRPSPKTVGGLVERAIALVREKPVLAVSGALGAGILAIRNPGYLGSLIRAFVDGSVQPHRPRGK